MKPNLKHWLFGFKKKSRTVKAVREGAVFLVVGAMPSIGNGLRLIPIDRTTPIGTGGTPMNGKASEVSKL